MITDLSVNRHHATCLGPLSVLSRVNQMHGSSDITPLIDGSWLKDYGNIFIFNLKIGDICHLSKKLRSNTPSYVSIGSAVMSI